MGPLERPLRPLFHERGQAASGHGRDGSCALSIAGLSFANIFAVFGCHWRFPSDLLADPGTGAILLTASETLLGFVFLFFLGLGLRTRFRLR
jgi:hypothetical protein